MTYEESNSRHRLSGILTRRASPGGLGEDLWILWLIFGLSGLAIVCMGLFAVIFGLNSILANPIGYDPFAMGYGNIFLVVIAGICIFGGGIFLCSVPLGEYQAYQRRKKVLPGTRGATALLDYAWDIAGYWPSRWGKVFKNIIAGLWLTLFISMFNWWAFVVGGGRAKNVLVDAILGPDGSAKIIKGIVLIFDGVILYGWVWQVLEVLRTLKFSKSGIAYTQFPYPLSMPVVIRWQPPSGIADICNGSFTLRCVEEWYEYKGSGKHRTSELIQEEIWSGTWKIDSHVMCQPGIPIEFRFEPSAESRPSSLSTTIHVSNRPDFIVFWSFDVELDMAGLDFAETYLVPVYAD